jgi:glycosyltransferase involved in cell wall biosynthesis
VLHINNFAEVEEAPIPASRAAEGIPEGAPLLLGLGRLHPAKAFDVLIEAVSTLPGVYVWIAGEGPARDELEVQIAALGLQERVKLLGWRDDRAALFKASTVCVFCSRYEPFGTVFVQSWAQDVPVIVADSDGPRQFVRDGEDGLVVPKDDASALRAAIERMLADAELRKNLVKNGLKRYHNEFTKEAAVQAYLDLYKRLTAS